MLIVASIKDYGYIHHNRKTGSVLNQDSLVYELIRAGSWIDMHQQIWRINHNPNEGFYIDCYDDGIHEECKTIEELAEKLKLLLEGSL